ncbi:MAG: Ig-like domain-containing protein, partial [Clostridiales bacterium]|nr:Ig-like domain-containing protein [Clostridiales bacterium]
MNKDVKRTTKQMLVLLLACLLLVSQTPLPSTAASGNNFALQLGNPNPEDDNLLEIITPPQHFEDDDTVQDAITEKDLEKPEITENEAVPTLVPFWFLAMAVEGEEEFPGTEADSTLATDPFEVWAYFPDDICQDSFMLTWQPMNITADIASYEIFLSQNNDDFYSIVNQEINDGTSTVLRGNMIHNLPWDEEYSFYVALTDVNGNTASSEIISFAPIAAAPSVTTNNPTNYTTGTSARLNGRVTANGGVAVTDSGFRYTSNWGQPIENWTKVSYGGGGTPFDIYKDISTGASTKYAYRAYAYNGSSAYGDIKYIVPASSVGLNYSSYTLAVNGTVSLSATVYPNSSGDPSNNATNKSITWYSNNSSVATVSTSGLVTAKSTGTATISARAHNYTTANIYATCAITVSSTPTYTVTFNGNGHSSGTAPPSKSWTAGGSVTMPLQGTLL